MRDSGYDETGLCHFGSTYMTQLSKSIELYRTQGKYHCMFWGENVV